MYDNLEFLFQECAQVMSSFVVRDLESSSFAHLTGSMISTPFE